MSTMPSVGSSTYSPGPNMVCSPEQEKVGTGSIEAIICPVYGDLRIRATVSFGIPIRSPRWHAAHAEAVHIGLMPTMALSFKTFVSRRCKLSILRVLYVERQTHFPRQKKHLMFLLDIKLYHDTFTLILVMIKYRIMTYCIFS